MFGVVFSPIGTDGSQLPASTIDAQAAAMARSGVESVRVPFSWAAIEPRDGAFDWRGTDPIVQAAAEHGLELLPNLIYTPTWASSHPHSAAPYLYAPSDPRQFARFATAIVDRYGSAARSGATVRRCASTRSPNGRSGTSRIFQVLAQRPLAADVREPAQGGLRRDPPRRAQR